MNEIKDHARLPHRNACQDFTRATSYGNLHEKCPERGHTLCASLRSRNACQDFIGDALYENLQVTGRSRE